MNTFRAGSSVGHCHTIIPSKMIIVGPQVSFTREVSFLDGYAFYIFHVIFLDIRSSECGNPDNRFLIIL